MKAAAFMYAGYFYEKTEAPSSPPDRCPLNKFGDEIIPYKYLSLKENEREITLLKGSFTLGGKKKVG